MNLNYINLRNKAADDFAGVTGREGAKVSFKTLEDLETSDLKIPSFIAGSDHEHKRTEQLIKACIIVQAEILQNGCCDFNNFFKQLNIYRGLE